MNRIRSQIEKLIEQANALREAVKRDTDPNYAPWMDKAKRSYRDAIERLNAMQRSAHWNKETIKQLQSVVDNKWNWTLAWLGLCGKPEPRENIRWFSIFPGWFALIPADLQLPALLDFRREESQRRSWLDEWLLDLSWETMTIPAGLTREAMGIIIRAVVENSDALAYFLTYCKKCALLFPMREGQLSGVLPSCPNCGNVEHAYAHAFG